MFKNIDYIKIFKDSWQLTWDNKKLWWFGLLAALAGGFGKSYSGSNGKSGGPGEQKMMEFISQHPVIFASIIGAILLICIVFLVIGLIGRGALIKSIDRVQKNELVGFKSGFKEGKSYFWKLFFLGLVLGFFLLLSMTILAIPVIFLFISKAYILGVLLAIFAVLIMIPLFILFAFEKVFGHIYIVLGKLSVWEALEAAYNLFRKNILNSIVMGLFFIPVGLALMIGMLMAIIPVALLFLVIGLVLYAAFHSLGIFLAAVPGILIIAAIILFVRAVYETFAQTAWILFFKEIATPEVKEEVKETVEEKKTEEIPTIEPVKTIEIKK